MKKLCSLAAVTLLASPASTMAEAPFFFIQLSDPQLGMFTDNKSLVQDEANLELAVAGVNRLQPAFVIVTGDLVNRPGDAAQIAAYRRIIAKIHPTIPVYTLPGNHDIKDEPTPESVANWVEIFGPDHYTFSHKGMVGIVLNSCIIHSPQQTETIQAAQKNWLQAELNKAKTAGTKHIVVFQHHPWFLANVEEATQYFNIPLASRLIYLKLFHEYGVRYLFSGHYHNNVTAFDGSLQNITTGAVGKPLGGSKSGLCIVTVQDSGLKHEFHDLEHLPEKVVLAAGKE